MPKRRTRPYAVLLAGVVLVATVLVAPPAQATFAPGAAGAGDSYFPLQGNGGYDVDHYDIAIRHDPAQLTINGTTTITATVTATPATTSRPVVRGARAASQ